MFFTNKQINSIIHTRNYNSDLGRFLSEDPIGFKGKDLNLYRYTNNHPIDYFDPYGNTKSSSSDGAVSVYYNSGTKKFVRRKDVRDITHDDFYAVVFGLPLLGVLSIHEVRVFILEEILEDFITSPTNRTPEPEEQNKEDANVFKLKLSPVNKCPPDGLDKV